MLFILYYIILYYIILYYIILYYTSKKFVLFLLSVLANTLEFARIMDCFQLV